ncbi:MAG: bacillithiol biosynthesis BshC [Candidatus Hydrothermarchaeales archaeon]
MVDQKKPRSIYLRAAWYGETPDFNPYNEISRNLKQAVSMGKMSHPDNLESLMKLLYETNRRYGVLTQEVKEKIDSIASGVAITAHQPIYLGGPSLILNKMALASEVSKISELSPLFFLADFDGVHKEITHTHLPSLSPAGIALLLPRDIIKDYEGCPVYTLPLPSEAHLTDTLERIRQNYGETIKKAFSSPAEKRLYIERLEEALTVVRTQYYASKNFSEWTMRILANIANITGELNIMFLESSSREFRRLLQGGFEYLMGDKNLDTFIKTINRVHDQLKENNITPTLRKRDKKYVPFFYECQSQGCNRRRVLLERENTILKGRCKKCGTAYGFSKNELSDIVEDISPRIDSRLLVSSFAIPLSVQITGGGETDYMAQVLPAMRSIKVDPPTTLLYSRIYYNNVIRAHLEVKIKQLLEKYGLPESEIYTCLGRYMNNATREEAMIPLTLAIEQEYRTLKKLEEIAKERDVSLYISSAHGSYSKEKVGQEISWNWIDLAVSSGVSDLINIYTRFYNAETIPGACFFANTCR